MTGKTLLHLYFEKCRIENRNCIFGIKQYNELIILLIYKEVRTG